VVWSASKVGISLTGAAGGFITCPCTLPASACTPSRPVGWIRPTPIAADARRCSRQLLSQPQSVPNPRALEMHYHAARCRRLHRGCQHVHATRANSGRRSPI
jgi:hypothetical protein